MRLTEKLLPLPISTHAPLARRDLTVSFPLFWVLNFNSRTSCEVRQNRDVTRKNRKEFQLTHLLRGATVSPEVTLEVGNISTHAPLARCDLPGGRGSTLKRQFQLTHLLRGATSLEVQPSKSSAFQLTHLLRGATTTLLQNLTTIQNFNSRTSCEVRRRVLSSKSAIFISTHAPLARCDLMLDVGM